MAKETFKIFLIFSSIIPFFLGTKFVNIGNKYVSGILLVLQTMFFITSLYYSAFVSLARAINSPIDGKQILETAGSLVFSVGIILMSMLLMMRRKRIIILSHKAFSTLPLTDQSKMNRSDILLSTSVMIYNCIVTTGMILWRLSDETKTSKYLLTVHEITSTSRLSLIIFETILENLSQNFIVSGVAVYVIFCHLVYTFVRHSFLSITKYLNEIQEHDDLLNIYDCLSSSLDSLKEFDSIFSLLPMIWFSNLFVYASINFVLLWTQKNPTRLVFPITFIAENICVYSAIIYLSIQRQHLEKQSDSIMRQVLQIRNESFIKTRITSTLKSICSFKMTTLRAFYSTLR